MLSNVKSKKWAHDSGSFGSTTEWPPSCSANRAEPDSLWLSALIGQQVGSTPPTRGVQRPRGVNDTQGWLFSALIHLPELEIERGRGSLSLDLNLTTPSDHLFSLTPHSQADQPVPVQTPCPALPWPLPAPHPPTLKQATIPETILRGLQDSDPKLPPPKNYQLCSVSGCF